MIGYEHLIPQNTYELLNLPLELFPKIILAIAIFIVGWILGWFVERIIESIFKALPFVDNALKNIGLEEVTRRAGVRVNLGKFFGVIVKIFIIILFLVASLDVLGLNTVNAFVVEKILGYIPSVVSAALVLVLGLLAAEVSAKFIKATSSAAKVNGKFAANVTKWAIVIFSVITAVGELGIANEIIHSVIVGVIAASSLALGLAFGLGGQQAASDFIEKIKRGE